MGQDMAKGRRTEIEFLNGFVVREGAQVGIPARANERLVDIVKRVERGDLKQDARPSSSCGSTERGRVHRTMRWLAPSASASGELDHDHRR
jgi:Ketopantoate reductase PanE/ApbA C terminal